MSTPQDRPAAGPPPDADAEGGPATGAQPDDVVPPAEDATRPHPGSGPRPEPEPEPGPEADAEPKRADADAEPVAEAKRDADVEPEPEPEPEPEADAEADADVSEPDGSEPEPGAEPGAGSEPDVPEAEADVPQVEPAVSEAGPDGGPGPAPGAAAPDEELPELTDDELANVLEALLLVVDSPVEVEALAAAAGVPVARAAGAVRAMAAAFAERGSGIDLREAGGGWRLYTRDRYAPYVEKLLLGGQRAKLTRAALETLAVIAYRQPVTRARVAAVRGVNCDGVIRTLLARGLVEETGTDTETGGFLYRTTELFLERLGLSSLEDLPPIAPLLPEVDSIDDV